MAFRFDEPELTLPFNSVCFGVYTNHFAEVAETFSVTSKSALFEIPLPAEEEELAPATLLHVYRRISQSQSTSKLLDPVTAARVAAFAHK